VINNNIDIAAPPHKQKTEENFYLTHFPIGAADFGQWDEKVAKVLKF